MCVMVRAYASITVQTLQSGTDLVRRITDFNNIASDRVERLRVFYYRVKIT